MKIGPRGGRGSEGTPDLVVYKNGEPVAEAGLKYYSKASETTFKQSNKYDQGRQKVSPADQVDKIKELSNARAKTNTLKSNEYADTAANATDRLKYDNVESTPLTRKGAQEIIEKPSQYLEQAFYNDLKCYAKSGAKYGAIIGGGMSLISNVQECYKGDKTISGAAVDVVKDTGISAVKGYRNWYGNCWY